MNGLDLLILALAAGAVIGGWRLGFVARVFSWLGLVVGVLLATRLVPLLIERSDPDEQLGQFWMAALILVGGATLGQALGYLVGARVRRSIPKGAARRTDQAGGAAAGVVGLLLTVWILLPAMAEVPAWPAQQARNSSLARWIDEHLPAPPSPLDVGEVFGDDFPSVFEGLVPAPEAGPPPESVPIDPAVVASGRTSTLRTEGEACGRIQSASGFVVSAELVVTNAHAVAGVDEPRVIRDDGAELSAEVVHYDPDVDLALLRVPGLDRAPMALGQAEEGEQGVVMGFPGGGKFEATPYEIASAVTARGRDIYDTQDTTRQVFVLASGIIPGDSGAALLSTEGTVVGVAFAVAPDRPGTAYALQIEELEAVLAAADDQVDDTGDCLA